MKTIKFLSVFFAVSVVTSTLQAQETITLKQAIQFALDHKLDAQKSKLDLENAQYKIDEVRAGALPQITGSGDLTYNPLLQQTLLPGDFMGKPGEKIKVSFGQKWQSSAFVNVNQQLFNQALFTGLKAARSTKEFYQINTDLTDELLIEKVANAYYQVFQTQLQLQTIQNNLDNTTKTQKVISGLVTAGLAKKIDLDRMSVAINNLEANKQQVLNGLTLTENALKFAIGMDMTKDIQLPKETFDVDGSILLEGQNIENRTEIKILKKQAELLELNKKAMISDKYPALSFNGNLGYLGIGSTFPIFASKDKVFWSGVSSVGLKLSVPIFNGGRNKAKINQADIEIRKAKLDLEDTKLGLSLATENAKSQIKNSLLTVDANKRNVQMAKEVLEDTQNNYRNGLATLTELLDAENAYATAQNNLNTSLLNYKIAEVQLVKANGNLKSFLN
ncbi:MAG: TolC family protein [Chitinophagaceae bacterium]|nr:MAG: TolC family protein [Chitinophagaceae bacterium]